MTFKGMLDPSVVAGDFTAYVPMGFAEREKPGHDSWDGPALDFIPVTSGKVYPQAVLSAKVQKLVASTWKSAQPSEGETRHGKHVTIGSHRGLTPVVQTFHSAPAIRFGGKEMQAPHLANVVPNDWALMKDIPLISAYGFRGDKRPPTSVSAAGGFSPNTTRVDDDYIEKTVHPAFNAYLQTKLGISVSLEDFNMFFKLVMVSEEEQLIFSYYNMWRSQVERESMHLGRMVANETMKGYISTTKAVTVAKAFARTNGYVYVTLVSSGFHLPSRGQHKWTEIFGEEEIASPVAIKWADVVGYRKVGPGVKFTGPLFFRGRFTMEDNQAFQHLYRLMSGIRQPYVM